MNYMEAKEFASILTLDPEVEFKSAIEAAIAAEESFKAQMAFESTLGAFVDDDEYRTENIRVATEAANAVKDALKKVADWFGKLIQKFSAFVRGIVFKSSIKKLKNFTDDGKKAGKIDMVSITEDEYKSFAEDWKTVTGKNYTGNLYAGVSASMLASESKQVFNTCKVINDDLKKALKDPSPDQSIEDLTKKAKAGSRLVRTVISVLNKAAKRGVVQKKNAEKQDAKNQKNADSILKKTGTANWSESDSYSDT